MAVRRQHGPGEPRGLTRERRSSATPHTHLLLIIESEAEQVAERRERALHCIGLSLLERILMGLTEGRSCAVTDPAALTGDNAIARAHADPHTRRIGASFGIPPAVF